VYLALGRKDASLTDADGECYVALMFLKVSAGWRSASQSRYMALIVVAMRGLGKIYPELVS
jgi:hypothetical protein